MAEHGEGDALQFEKAEYEHAAPEMPRCANCQAIIADEYYQVGSQVACRNCRDATHATLNASTGGFRRLFRAALFGVFAALVCAVIWYGIRALTGYEFGLVGIIVGLAVGGAVHFGSDRRGGWRYQALAMALTYAAIVSSYVPDVFKELKKGFEQQQTATAGQASKPAGSGATSTGPATTAPISPAKPAGEPKMTPARMAVGLFILVLLLFVISCAIPFLAGIKNIMGIIIIGIALYEAWKINKKAPIPIAGPFRVGAGAQAAASTDA